jgi:hypothetical protein
MRRRRRCAPCGFLRRRSRSRELARAYVNLCQLATWSRDGPSEVAVYAQRSIALGERFSDPGAINAVFAARFDRAAYVVG